MKAVRISQMSNAAREPIERWAVDFEEGVPVGSNHRYRDRRTQLEEWFDERGITGYQIGPFYSVSFDNHREALATFIGWSE